MVMGFLRHGFLSGYGTHGNAAYAWKDASGLRPMEFFEWNEPNPSGRTVFNKALPKHPGKESQAAGLCIITSMLNSAGFARALDEKELRLLVVRAGVDSLTRDTKGRVSPATEFAVIRLAGM